MKLVKEVLRYSNGLGDHIVDSVLQTIVVRERDYDQVKVRGRFTRDRKYSFTNFLEETTREEIPTIIEAGRIQEADLSFPAELLQLRKLRPKDDLLVCGVSGKPERYLRMASIYNRLWRRAKIRFYSHLNDALNDLT